MYSSIEASGRASETEIPFKFKLTSIRWFQFLLKLLKLIPNQCHSFGNLKQPVLRGKQRELWKSASLSLKHRKRNFPLSLYPLLVPMILQQKTTNF